MVCVCGAVDGLALDRLSLACLSNLRPPVPESQSRQPIPESQSRQPIQHYAYRLAIRPDVIPSSLVLRLVYRQSEDVLGGGLSQCAICMRGLLVSCENVSNLMHADFCGAVSGCVLISRHFTSSMGWDRMRQSAGTLLIGQHGMLSIGHRIEPLACRDRIDAQVMSRVLLDVASISNQYEHQRTSWGKTLGKRGGARIAANESRPVPLTLSAASCCTQYELQANRTKPEGRTWETLFIDNVGTDVLGGLVIWRRYVKVLEHHMRAGRSRAAAQRDH